MNKLSKNGQRILGWILCFIVIFTSVPLNAFAKTDSLSDSADGGIQLLGAQSESQSASEPEVVGVNAYSGEERSYLFDDNWKFNLGDAANAEKAVFDDSAWRNISIPHDYSIEQEYTQTGEAESGFLPGGIGWYRKAFTVDKSWKDQKTILLDFGGVYMNAEVWLNGRKLGEHPYGYTTFAFDITDKLDFDGQNILAVKVNNNIPTSRYYSGSGIYRSVHMLVTDKVHIARYGTTITVPDLETTHEGDVTVNIQTQIENKSSKEQVVEVKHTISDKNGKAVYSATEAAVTGLVSGNEVPEVSGNEIPEVSGNTAQEADVTTGSGISGSQNDLPALSLNDGMVTVGTTGPAISTMSLIVNKPKLWSLENPNLYTVKTELLVEGTVVDTVYTDFGFRWTTFDRDKGFALNGEFMKLKGVCMHHDQGSLGAKAYYRAIERQVELLKEMGCNSIRVTHNPAASELIEICNKKGMLLVEESFDAWDRPKNGNRNEYAIYFNKVIEESNTIYGAEAGETWAEFDLKEMVSRGKNAPSIIMWSLGNEIMEGNSGPFTNYPGRIAEFAEWIEEVDLSKRPITTGDNAFKKGNATAVAINDALAAAGGVVGLNYCGTDNYKSAYNNHDSWIIYGSETASHTNTRGVYNVKGNTKRSDKQLTAYDQCCVGWGKVASDAWYDVIKNDFVAGEYVWTGFDYIGEPTPWNGTGTGSSYGWPAPKSSYFGIIDTAGFPKDNFYLYQSLWNEKVHTLHMLPAWNENVVSKDANGNVEVVVYSDAASVELFFTPKGSSEKQSLGKKTFTEKKTPAGYTYQLYEGEGKYSAEHKNLYLGWSVPYADGKLTAVAYDKSGNVISDTEGRSEVETAGAPAKLTASADRAEISADGKDLCYITVDVTDIRGNIIPDASNHITFDIEGEGKIVGVDNGNAMDHASYLLSERDAMAGKALVIVQSTKNAGQFTLTAAAKGLEKTSVTVTTKQAGESGERKIQSYEISRSYYVKLGEAPVLPATVVVNYSDGSREEKGVIWEKGYLNDGSLNQVGSFSVNGKIEGTEILVSVSVNMLSEVAALLNYSTGIILGDKPALPAARPAVLADGTILDASFPVVWEDVDALEFPEGITKVKGISNIFGKDYEVTAFVRAEKETETIGANVAGAALKLFEDTPEDLKSDTLEALIDGMREADPNARAIVNPTIWSNYYSAQQGSKAAAITLTFATAQSLGSVKLYHYLDAFSACMPEKVEFYWSPTENEEDYKPIVFTQSEPVSQGDHVKMVTYTFDEIVEAVAIRVVLTNSSEEVRALHANVGLSEMELYRHERSFDTNSSAAISEWKVHGTNATAAQLSEKIFRTMAYDAEIEIASEQNTAYTILPAQNDVIHILTESEDHKNRGEYQVILKSVSDMAADDASSDYPVGQLTVEAGNYQAQEPPGRVLDNDTSTLWHTNWNADTPLENRWITLILQEEATVKALRYLPRSSGGKNGMVTKYRVEVSSDNVNWAEVSNGSWASSTGWKLALFNQQIKGKYVRLTGIECVTDHPINFMSAAEIRVAVDNTVRTDITDAVVTLPKDNYTYTGKEVKPRPASVVAGDQSLTYGLDYILSYQNNIEQGEAVLTITGVNNYFGTVTKKFMIVPPVFHQVTFETNGGTPIEEVSILEGEKLKEPVTVREGYVFGGWYTDADFTTKWNFAEDTVIGNTKLHAKWIELYQVTFETNGGTASLPAEVMNGGLLAEPAGIVKEGYILEGWYTDAAFTTKWNFAEDKVTANMTLFAKWKKITEPETKFTVTFESNGGSSAASVEVDKDGLVAEPAGVTKEGYVLEGWYSDAAFTTKWNFAEDKVTANMTLFAKWKKITEPETKFTVTFESNGGSSAASVEVDKDGLVAEPAGVTKEGYVLEGWYSDAAFTTKWNFAQDKVTGDVTLYARWIAEGTEKFTVTFESNGGSSAASVEVVKDGMVAEPAGVTKEGYVLEGWYRDAAFTTKWNFAQDKVTGDLTLYAKWQEKENEKFIVTFETNGGSALAPVQVGEGRLVTEPAGVLKEGYVLEGWYSDAAFTTKWDFAADKVTGNLTLYAKWVKTAAEKYTITFETNGGSAVDAVVLEKGSLLTEPTGVTKKDCTLEGWYTDAAFTQKWDFAADQVTQSMTLYAKWVIVFEEEIYVLAVPSHTYTGTAYKPELEVYDRGTRLVLGRDYTVSYKNNVNVWDGADENKRPQAVVKGKGNYSSKTAVVVNLDILPRSIEGGDFTVTSVDAMNSNKDKILNVPFTVKYGKKALNKKKDLEISYEQDGTVVSHVAKEGSYTVVAKGIGNYTGTIRQDLTVVDAAKKKLTSKLSVKLNKKSVNYTGEPITLEGEVLDITVKDGRTVLYDSANSSAEEKAEFLSNFEISYENNTEVGTAAIKVTAKTTNEKYAGSVVLSFKITGTAITKAKFRPDTFKTKKVFNGQEQRQDGMKLFIKIGAEEKDLAEGIDYTVRYSNNIKAGKATAEIIGRGAYAGTMKKTFSITPVKFAMAKGEVNVAEVKGENGVLSVSMAAISYEQNRAGVTPEIALVYTADDGSAAYRLTEGVDYTLSYKNNKNISTEKKVPAVNVKLKGSFTGSLNSVKTFSITPKSLSGEGIRIEVTDMQYKAAAQVYKAKAAVYDHGVKLSGKDFKIEGYEGNTNEGFETGKIKTAKVILTAGASGDYTGTVTAEFRISEKLINKGVFKAEPKAYTGKEIRLTAEDITATLGGSAKVTLEEGRDYRIAADSYTNNVKCGTAKVTVEGMGEYAGSKVISFKIVPKELLELKK